MCITHVCCLCVVLGLDVCCVCVVCVACVCIACVLCACVLCACVPSQPSLLERLLLATAARPWLWGVYVFTVGLPTILFISFMWPDKVWPLTPHSTMTHLGSPHLSKCVCVWSCLTTLMGIRCPHKGSKLRMNPPCGEFFLVPKTSKCYFLGDLVVLRLGLGWLGMKWFWMVLNCRSSLGQ